MDKPSKDPDKGPADSTQPLEKKSPKANKYEEIIEQTSGHVLAELLPKLEEMEKRLEKHMKDEMSDVRLMVEGIAKGQSIPKETDQQPPAATGPQLKEMMKNDPEIANWINSFKKMEGQFDNNFDPNNPINALGKVPDGMKSQMDPTQSMMGGSPMGGMMQFIQMMKMLEGGGMMGGGMMQEVMYRQYLDTMLQQRQQGMAATKFFMKIASMGPEKIAEFERMSDNLMQPINDGIAKAAEARQAVQ